MSVGPLVARRLGLLDARRAHGSPPALRAVAVPALTVARMGEDGLVYPLPPALDRQPPRVLEIPSEIEET